MNGRSFTPANGRTFHPSGEAEHSPGLPREKDAVRALPAIEDASSLLAEDVPEPPEVIAEILHEGAKLVLGGGSKSFKTWLLLWLAICVATERKWLGFQCNAGRVLYINLEIQRSFFRKRIKAICEAQGAQLVDDSLHLWNLRGHAADLSTLIPQIIAGAGQKKYTLVIIDPIYKGLGARDENAAGDIASLLNEVERLAVESGAAVAFGAHFSKGNQAGKESIDRIGGSGVFARDPDSILTLTRHEEDEAFTLDCTLRNHPPVEPFVVRWKFPTMERDTSLDPGKLKQVSGRQKLHSAEELLGVLGSSEMTYSAWLDAAKTHAGMGASTFKSLRTELVNAGQVHYSKFNQTYQKVEKAKKAN